MTEETKECICEERREDALKYNESKWPHYAAYSWTCPIHGESGIEFRRPPVIRVSSDPPNQSSPKTRPRPYWRATGRPPIGMKKGAY